MDVGKFADAIGGEVVAGCVIATVDGKRQYLYRNGEFTMRGREMYNEWTHRPEPDVAIATAETPPRRKFHKSGR